MYVCVYVGPACAKPCAVAAVKMSDDEADEPGCTPAGRHHTCSSCAEPAKYTCPGCEARSCSLACVRAHKEASGCSGRRPPSTYRPMADFDDLTLLRDYQFLEHANRTLDSADRRLRDADLLVRAHLSDSQAQEGRQFDSQTYKVRGQAVPSQKRQTVRSTSKTESSAQYEQDSKTVRQ